MPEPEIVVGEVVSEPALPAPLPPPSADKMSAERPAANPSGQSLALCQLRKEGASFGLQGTTADDVAARVAAFFQQAGYKLESGTPTNGVFGTGSDTMRFLFGAFVRRYKFNVQIGAQDQMVRVELIKAMSGAMGGVIGYAAMNKETKRVSEGLRDCLAR